MADQDLKNIIEAGLLAAGEPLTIDRMLAMFPEGARPSREEVHEVLRALEAECEGRGIELRQIDRGYRFQTRAKYAEWIARLSEERPPRYSRALLETLAIIAYRQPVTRGEIEDIRGVTVSTEIIKTLLEREWVRQVGQRDVPGRPGLYGTTRAFLEYFNLKSLDELPPLSALRDIEEVARQFDLSVEQANGQSSPGQNGEPEAQAGTPEEPDESETTELPTEAESPSSPAA